MFIQNTFIGVVDDGRTWDARVGRAGWVKYALASLKNAMKIIIDHQAFSAILRYGVSIWKALVPAVKRICCFNLQIRVEEGTFCNVVIFGVLFGWPGFVPQWHGRVITYRHGLARLFSLEFIEAGHFKNGDWKFVDSFGIGRPSIDWRNVAFRIFEPGQVFRFSSKRFLECIFWAANCLISLCLLVKRIHTYL